MRLTVVTVLIAFAGAVAGCASESTSGGATAEQEPPATATAATVSGACQAAMATYHEELLSDTDPNVTLDEGPLQIDTLKACKSKAEWLAGVQPYSEGDGCIACAEADKVFVAMCGGREKLPACQGKRELLQSFFIPDCLSLATVRSRMRGILPLWSPAA